MINNKKSSFLFQRPNNISKAQSESIWIFIPLNQQIFKITPKRCDDMTRYKEMFKEFVPSSTKRAF